MNAITRPKLTPAPEPKPAPTTPLTDALAADNFPPSAELGDQLRRLHEAQAEIDRRRIEELARLREIQDRD